MTTKVPPPAARCQVIPKADRTSGPRCPNPAIRSDTDLLLCAEHLAQAAQLLNLSTGMQLALTHRGRPIRGLDITDMVRLLAGSQS